MEKIFYEPDSVFELDGKNYEVVKGNMDDEYNACGKCAFSPTPGACIIANNPKLSHTCSANVRPDGNDVYFRETTRMPNVQQPIDETNSTEEYTETDDDPPLEDTPDKIIDIEPEPEKEERIVEPSQPVSAPKMNVVRAKDLNGNTVGGILVNDDNGHHYIMPYGSKVFMDGTCNLVQFQPDTLSYQTPYRDMDGKQIYTGDTLSVICKSENSDKHFMDTVVVQKLGVVPHFYSKTFNEHSKQIDIVDNMVINGFIDDIGHNMKEHVSDWLADVKNTVSKLLLNGDELGASERKTLYELEMLDKCLKNL